jgi:alginate O-acetyltransferase complex protein AlgI
MLFNSFIFVFLFLPVTLVGFYMAAQYGRRPAVAWLVAASIVFYGWWEPAFVILLLASIIWNYSIGLGIQSSEGNQKKQSLLLALGIGVNLSFLFYYKYLDFIFEHLEKIGINIDIDTGGIILPLGISFYTFTQIAYLIDCRAGIARDRRLLDYFLFVTFFPHLIAGPILHHREMMPQFENQSTYKFKLENLLVGLVIFVIGLSKKVLIADPLSPVVGLGFDTVFMQLSFFEAWIVVLAYSMQLYFDFLYLYNPIALSITRRRARKGKAIGPRGAVTLEGFTWMIAFPTIVTMFLSGVWHGAGVNFIIFGILHAIYLTINHAWRVFRPTRQAGEATYWTRISHILASWLLMYLAVLVAQVFFRAPYFPNAIEILSAMAGLKGFSVNLTGLDVNAVEALNTMLAAETLMQIGFAMLVALAAPNALELMAKYEPVLEKVSKEASQIRISLTPRWGIAMGGVAALSVLCMAGATEFLYFQF